MLRVRDNGIGIAPEMLPRVFELFVQERQALDRREGGLGLGLAIVRSLVELHGGTVTVQSDGRDRDARSPSACRYGTERRRSPRARAWCPAHRPGGGRRAAHPGRRRQPGRRRDAGARPRPARATRRASSTTAPRPCSRRRASDPRSRSSTSACRSWTATSWPGACARQSSGLRLVAVTGYGQAEDPIGGGAGFDAHW